MLYREQTAPIYVNRMRCHISAWHSWTEGARTISKFWQDTTEHNRTIRIQSIINKPACILWHSCWRRTICACWPPAGKYSSDQSIGCCVSRLFHHLLALPRNVLQSFIFSQESGCWWARTGSKGFSTYPWKVNIWLISHLGTINHLIFFFLLALTIWNLHKELYHGAVAVRSIHTFY